MVIIKNLSNLELSFLQDNGFILFRNMISDGDLTELDNIIKIEKIPTSKEDASEWVKLKTKYQRNKRLLQIANEYISNIIDGEFTFSSQIAYRFPNEVDTGPYHIDNFTEKDFGRRTLPREFTFLIGFYLTDNLEDDSGNFTVYPWSHHPILEYCKSKGYAYLQENGLNDMRETLKFANKYQVKAHKSDVIIADRFLAHQICGKNNSSDIRKIIWFRVSLPNQQFGIQPYFTEHIGGMHWYMDNGVLHIKTGQEPNLFASKVSICRNKLRTNGFLSRDTNRYLFDKVKNMGLAEKVNYFTNIDYKNVIDEIHKMNDEGNEKIGIRFVLGKFHSRSKRRISSKWLEELGLKGVYYDAGLEVEGEKSCVELFKRKFLSFHWKKINVEYI